MIILSDEAFVELCHRFGLGNQKTKISYQDFLQRFEVKDTPEGHKVRSQKE